MFLVPSGSCRSALRAASAAAVGILWLMYATGCATPAGFAPGGDASPPGHRLTVPGPAAGQGVSGQPRGQAAPEQPRGLMLIAHGYGNNPTHWPARLIAEIQGSPFDISGWDIRAHDWEAEASRILSAARSGEAIGRELAGQVMTAGDPYAVIHLVGQSLGAFLTQGFLDEYRALGGRALVHATFLDPFLVRGALGFGHGVRNFGRGADFAENYLVRGEPVLGSNRPLRYAYNIDISALVDDRMRDQFVGPHWWVVRYYQHSVVNQWPGFDRSPIARKALRPGPEAQGQQEAFAVLRGRYPAGDLLKL